MNRLSTPYKSPTPLWVIITLAASIPAFVFLTTTFSLQHLYDGKASLLDIGVFVQAFETFLASGTPTITLSPPFEPMHWLGFHFSPLLLIFSPLYALWPSPECFIWLESMLIGLTAVPIYHAGRLMKLSPAISLCWALLFLSHPLILNGTFWPFHEMSLASLLIAWAMVWLLEGRFWWMIAMCVGLALTKEHYGLAICGFGLAWGWQHKDWHRGLLAAAAGIAILALTLFVLMPWFNAGDAHPMLAESGHHTNRYHWLSESPAIAWERFTDFFFTPATLLYAFLLFGCLLFLPLAAPFLILPAMADLAVNLLSEVLMPRSPFAYHSLAIVPVLVIAAIYVSAKRGHAPIAPACLILTIALSSAVSFMPTPYSFSSWDMQWKWPAPDARIQAIENQLPPDAVLSAQANMAPFFAARERIYPFPSHLDEADYVLLHHHWPFPLPNGPFAAPYAIARSETHMETLQRFAENAPFHVIYADGPWMLLERTSATQPIPELRAAIPSLQLQLDNAIKRSTARFGEQVPNQP